MNKKIGVENNKITKTHEFLAFVMNLSTTVKIIAVSLVLIITIWLVFFPGLIPYLNVKLNYDSIDKKIQDYQYYDVKCPDDYIEYSEYGITLKAPHGLEIKETEYNDEIVYANSKNDLELELTFYKPVEQKLTFNKGDIILNEKQFQAFCDDTNIIYPTSNYERNVIIRNLTFDDFNVHDAELADIFLKLAEWKEWDQPYGNDWYYFNGEKFRGLLYDCCGLPSYDGECCIVLWLYPQDNPDTEYMVRVETDKATAANIIATIGIDKKAY